MLSSVWHYEIIKSIVATKQTDCHPKPPPYLGILFIIQKFLRTGQPTIYDESMLHKWISTLRHTVDTTVLLLSSQQNQTETLMHTMATTTTIITTTATTSSENHLPPLKTPPHYHRYWNHFHHHHRHHHHKHTSHYQIEHFQKIKKKKLNTMLPSNHSTIPANKH